MNKNRLPLSAEKITTWARLLRVSQGLLTAVEKDLKAAGFPPLVWYDLLLELGRNQNQPHGLRPYQLQQEMLLPQYNLSRLIERMEKSELIIRTPCPDDGRGHIVHITAAGKALQQDMWPAYQTAIERHFAGKLSAEETDLLSGILLKLR